MPLASTSYFSLFVNVWDLLAIFVYLERPFFVVGDKLDGLAAYLEMVVVRDGLDQVLLNMRGFWRQCQVCLCVSICNDILQSGWMTDAREVLNSDFATHQGPGVGHA